MTRVNNNNCQTENYPRELFEPLPQSRSSKASSGGKDKKGGRRSVDNRDTAGERSKRAAARYLQAVGSREPRIEGPYARAGVNSSRDRVEAEAGLMRLRTRKGGYMTAVSAKLTAGREGVNGEAQMFHGRTGKAAVQGELEVLRGNAYAIRNKDMTGCGATASVIGGAVTVRAMSPKTDDDVVVRAGAALSAGGAVRVHHSDEDKDGKKEYGLGVDVGPVTVDLKSENPLATMAAMIRGILAPGAAAGRYARWVAAKAARK
jgi:hypothetical protein